VSGLGLNGGKWKLFEDTCRFDAAGAQKIERRLIK
jgi:hypothetical protein